MAGHVDVPKGYVKTLDSKQYKAAKRKEQTCTDYLSISLKYIYSIYNYIVYTVYIKINSIFSLI